ncbi:actin-binding protein ipp-like [Plakobranchus ocellatus]|uniref:Actin-binding protein ipp-like n=1 Tax=Plakobranchus ocellatus TaxID=259542 RepID=A0AAV3Z604_9GAST|nr:actin-binding protein ipp-like [Plakobranchus ocellatus]
MATNSSKCFDMVGNFDLSYIMEVLNPTFRQEIEDYFASTPMVFEDAKEMRKAESWLDWAKRLQYLKVVETEIPDFILPGKNSGEIIDVKVFSRRGPDDAIYDTYQSVREKVARGNCFLRINKGPLKGTRCILHALKKFTGGLGDDDDKDRGDNHTWKKYFAKPLDSARKVIATKKANGEAAHLSCLEMDGHRLICAGSKNVHILIRNRGDIACYRGDRYRIAAEVCHSIMDNLEEMETVQRDRLLDFLIATRLTAVFEILAPNHQHVEDLSYLSKPVVQFITWTSTELEPDADQMLCTVPPHLGIELARAFGLQTVDYETIPVVEVKARMKMIRQGYQYEGEVLYFLDSRNRVMGLLKKKTIWYIICRAIREKARNAGGSFMKDRGSFSIQKSENQVRKRLKDIQGWLGLSNEATLQWENLGIAFVKWTIESLETKKMGMEGIADVFPVNWKRFLEENGLSDKIATEFVEEEEEKDEEHLCAAAEAIDDDSS